LSGPPELVIFDCDGVLVDSERIAIRLDVEVLGELGWTLTEEEVVERFVGISQADMVRQVEEHLGRKLPQAWDEHFVPRYRAALEAELAPVEGIVEALDAITTPKCVASSSMHERIRFSLGLTDLLDRFEGRIFSATDVPRGKPAPDLFLHAAEALGVAPRACAVIEDSAYGVAAARAAGMRAFGYAGGVTLATRLEGEGTVVFDDMRDLPRLLEAG
jgi:HAD superfamily hydrolase (TIGR01509 family)